jgi:hypothetical protein
VEGAPAIRAWKPVGPGLSDSKDWLFGEAMISVGDSLFVPMIRKGVVELDVRTMAVKRVIALPLPGSNFIESIACSGDAMVMNIKDRLFTRALGSDGRSWTEIEPSGVTAEDSLTWHVQGFDDGFFVGSVISRSEVKSPRMLAGMARNGIVNWLASSDRRPALHPLDAMNPRSSLLAYRNATKKTMILMRQSNGRTPLVELESGREVSSVRTGGIAQSRGEMPLYWNHSVEGIDHLIAFDPAREQPRLVLKSKRSGRDLPEIWRDIRPEQDGSKPEFQGVFIASIVHGGRLWILKRERGEAGRFDDDDPNAFRLVRVGLDGGKAVVIPLRYEVPEAIRMLVKSDEQAKRASLDKPVINMRSLTATPGGLFFASSGYEHLHWYGDRANGGNLAPVLLHVRWEEIHAWLAKNAPESVAPASP